MVCTWCQTFGEQGHNDLIIVMFPERISPKLAVLLAVDVREKNIRLYALFWVVAR